ncbi:alpha/beta fold hydrolase [Microbacterium sp. MPKO10]|uniref:alpha/beta fold hydrolase n=1 Tax=Microbacterium sp. MPKO10 TaxID=2989818 RepID=UPI0022368DAD|nr:alpha/beta hydrolase [Microbacterium sp. MPKO10]MCW4458895.1 alpha/beta hydrolase [Microbacterium sp. MPKO10]
MDRRYSIRLGNTHVSVREWSASEEVQQRTVILLHGGGVDNATLSWGETGPALAEAGYRVIAPDHPGFGDSPRAAWSLTQENLVAYVGDLIDALGVERYAIGGLSLGGGMSIGHVLDRPDRVVGAMLLGSYGIMPRLSDGPFAWLSHPATWMLLRTGLMATMMRSYTRSPERMEQGLTSLVRDPARRTPELVADVLNATKREESLEVFEQWQRDQIAWSTLRSDYSPRLGSIVCPALVIHGERDSGVPVQRARHAAQTIPNATLVEVAGAGHWVQRDAPRIAVPAMTTFLDDLTW